MNTGDIIKSLRRSRHLTQEQLGEIVGVQKSAIAKYERGRVENLKRATIEKLADYFNVSPSYILGIDVDEELIPITINSGYQLPIFTMIPASCGTGTWAEDDVMDYIVLPTSLYKFNKHKKYFGQTAKGDSMIGAGIDDGDLLIFEQCSAPENNMVGAFSIDDERCVCKRIKFIDDKIFLVSANDNYMPIEVKDNFRMVGLLKYVVKEFRQ